MRNILRYLLPLVAFAEVIGSAAPPCAQTAEQVRRVGAFYAKADGFSGNVVVVKDEVIVSNDSYGFASLELGVANNAKTRFAIGSFVMNPKQERKDELMAEGVNGGPARFYRRRSLAEQREAFQIATAQVAVLESKAERVKAEAEARINRLDLQILKLKQQEGKAAARRRSQPQSVAIGSKP